MLILHVITSMDPINGGPSQGIRNLDKAMQNLGVTREVVCSDAPNSLYLKNDRFIIHALGSSKGVWRYEANLATWLINNILRFDVVIVNGLWLYHSFITWKVFNELKMKVPQNKLPRLYVMPHGMLDPYFQRAKERWPKAVRNWFYWKLIEKKIINNADGLLFTCKTEMQLARGTFKPYHPKNEYNIGYGIEEPPAYNDDMNIAFDEFCPGLYGEPYLLFLSRIHVKKGIDLLLKAFIELGDAMKTAGKKMPKLVIAGPGFDTSYGKQLQERFELDDKISKNIFFPGMLTGDAKWGAFYGCEAFVLPSHQENFGIAVVEAMACSKAVLISDQVNISPEIYDGGAGLVEPDSLAGTRKLLNDWITMPEEKKREMCNNAKKTYQANFTIEGVALNLSAVVNGKM